MLNPRRAGASKLLFFRPPPTCMLLPNAILSHNSGGSYTDLYLHSQYASLPYMRLSRQTNLRGPLNRRGPFEIRGSPIFLTRRVSPAAYFRGGGTHLREGKPICEGPRIGGPPFGSRWARIFLTFPVSTSGILGVMLFFAFSTQFLIGALSRFLGWGAK